MPTTEKPIIGSNTSNNVTAITTVLVLPSPILTPYLDVTFRRGIIPGLDPPMLAGAPGHSDPVTLDSGLWLLCQPGLSPGPHAGSPGIFPERAPSSWARPSRTNPSKPQPGQPGTNTGRSFQAHLFCPAGSQEDLPTVPLFSSTLVGVWVDSGWPLFSLHPRAVTVSLTPIGMCQANLEA